MTREFYTAEGFATMKWELTKACIHRAVEDAVFATGTNRCFSGDPESGYWYALHHDRDLPHEPSQVPPSVQPAMVHYRLPPVTPNRASVEPAVLEDYLGDPVQTFDPWGSGEGSAEQPQGLYAKYADGVDRVFQHWDQLPDERDFWGAAKAVRDAVDPLASPLTYDSPLFDLEWNLGVPGVSYNPNSAGPPAPMEGQVIDVLTNYYVIPLDGTLMQQAYLGTLLGAELEGLGDMWQTARQMVMEIGNVATASMQGDGTIDDTLGGLSVIGKVLAVVSLIPPLSTPTAVAGVILLGAQTVAEGIESRRGELQASIEHDLSNASSDNVLEKLADALGRLRDHITTEEGTAERFLDIAYQRSYERPRIDPPNSYELTFDLPGPEAVRSADPAGFAEPGAIAVDLPRLRRVGSGLTTLGSHLSGVEKAAAATDRGNGMWLRPDTVGGTGRDGAYDDFKNLHKRLCWLLRDTAGELEAAGDHVALAANALESSDESADRALRDHAREAAGITAPDPAQPPPP